MVSEEATVMGVEVKVGLVPVGVVPSTVKWIAAVMSVSLSVTDWGVAYTPGVGEAVGSGGGGGAGVPVPARATLWVVAASVGVASSVTTRLALRAAADPGLKVRLDVTR